MVPSVDTYLKKEVTKMLDVILGECYIIDEILKDFDTEIVETFKKTYCKEIKAKHEVTVRYSFPDIKSAFLASYIVQLGEGTESRDSIGGIEGTFVGKEKGYLNEDVEVKSDGSRLYLEVSNPIGSYLGSNSIEFKESDNLSIDDNKLCFSLEGNEELIGMMLDIRYSAKYEPVAKIDEPHGTYRGFTSTDSISITAISNSIDTVRCLDAILKTILIMLRYSPQEQNYYGLQKVRFTELAPVIDNGETRIFGRSTVLSYTTSYSVEYNVANVIRKIIAKEKVKPSGKS